MRQKISPEEKRAISIYLGKSIPAEELYFTCENMKISGEVDLTVIDPFGTMNSEKIIFSEQKNSAPHPIGIKSKDIRRCRILRFNVSQNSLATEMNFFWNHAPGKFEPLQFSVINWK